MVLKRLLEKREIEMELRAWNRSKREIQIRDRAGNRQEKILVGIGSCSYGGCLMICCLQAGEPEKPMVESSLRPKSQESGDWCSTAGEDECLVISRASLSFLHLSVLSRCSTDWAMATCRGERRSSLSFTDSDDNLFWKKCSQTHPKVMFF